MRRRDFIAALSALAAAPLAFAENERPRTIRYARTPGVATDLQSLDLYGAASPGAKRPILAFIHGGGWEYGDKANMPNGRDKAAVFTPRFIYASINYRLSPAAKHPAHVQDVAAAIAWLHANAFAFGGDPDRIYVMGHSAGAHLAALVATDEHRLGVYKLPLTTIKGIIALDGVYDVLAGRPVSVIASGTYYGGAFGADAKSWDDASPVMHVAPGKGIAPFLLVHKVQANSITQTEALAKKLRQAGVGVETLLTPKQSHGEINRQFGRPGDMVTAHAMTSLTKWGA